MRRIAPYGGASLGRRVVGARAPRQRNTPNGLIRAYRKRPHRIAVLVDLWRVLDQDGSIVAVEKRPIELRRPWNDGVPYLRSA